MTRVRLNYFAMPGQIERLERYANSDKFRGYLKPWKARSMIDTLGSIPDIFSDWERLLTYVKNCLNMEGFDDNACEFIAKHLLVEHLNALRNGEYMPVSINTGSTEGYDNETKTE